MTLFWFRRDLRLEDNTGLYHALQGGQAVLPIFIFDRDILDRLEDDADARVTFIYKQLARLKEQLQDLGSDLKIYYGRPLDIWEILCKELQFVDVYANRDYEPYAKQREIQVSKLLASAGKQLHTFKDQVIFESSEVLKADGTPYTVFTPYKRKWLAALDCEQIRESAYLQSYDSLSMAGAFLNLSSEPMPSLADIGFTESKITIPSTTVARSIIQNYAEQRDFPAKLGTSRLGVHFRFGTISIREKARHAAQLSEVYLSELIWREFYSQILDHFPHIVTGAFKSKYDAIEWRNDLEEFDAWCEGRTGYPIVDAGMRELNSTGFMHNRVRMITASFLTKHLLIDWRWGEAYFASKLLDYDLASNNGGWQWAAGCGTDAAPYFRIFNPHTQLAKFDPQLQYVNQFVPEYGKANYPDFIVDHKFARERCLATYKKALG